MRRIPHQEDTAGRQALELEVTLDVRLGLDFLDGRHLEDLAKLRQHFGDRLQGVVQLFLLAGFLEPVVGIRNIGVGLHEVPVVAAGETVGENVVQPHEADET